ncbi:hypothetical protein [Nesterenkonia ebinurensis]|uniref:hypothetical protein n=1 Tax=Nesterenkonia ebinurensis TaxID=2608252 RepID=UPI00123DA4ED|nr:hypothetical protein [Nesterenkonia ebinurensis]
MRFLITEDVDDFDPRDLDAAGASAVTADLFMSHQWTEDAYRNGIELLATTAKSTPERIHQALERLHPHLTTAFDDLYPEITPDALAHAAPAVEYRGRHRLPPASH